MRKTAAGITGMARIEAVMVGMMVIGKITVEIRGITLREAVVVGVMAMTVVKMTAGVTIMVLIETVEVGMMAITATTKVGKTGGTAIKTTVEPATALEITTPRG